MERLMEDALRIQRLLPWIESDEDIINFMRKIPLDRSHLRNQLTLRYFLKQTDSSGDGFEKGIEDDAREIVIVVPDISYKEIKDRLTVLGNMSNRKEIVLRQVLYEKRDLDRIVNEIDVSPVKKRKAEQSQDSIFDLDSSSNETNIKIKIRKRDGNLEVVSKIKQERTSPVKAISSSQPVDEPASSSTSITSRSESSSPNSTVPSTSAETNNDPCPEFTSILQKVIDKNQQSQPSTSSSTMPVKRKTRSQGGLNNNIIEDEPDFNLLKYLQEITKASERRIIQLCKRHKLDLTQRPSEKKLSCIVSELIEGIIEVKSDDSNMSVDSLSDESTEEYQLPDKYQRFMMRLKENQDGTAPESAVEKSTLNPEARQFKLKAPVLNLPSATAVSDEDLTLPKPIILSPSGSNDLSRKRPILRRPLFTIPGSPTNAEENTFPAMPKQFLDRLRAQRSKSAENLLQSPEIPVDLSSPEINIPPICIRSTSHLSEAGPSNVENKKKTRIVDENLVLRLIEMFPEACPNYIRDICDGKQWCEFDDVVTVILLAENYPRRPHRPPSPAKEVDLEEQYEILKELLPQADPTYLRMQCEKYNNDDEGLKQFINHAMESNDYPTMKEYLRKQQLSAQQKQYTTDFNIEHFIQLFPEPEKTFNDPNRQIQVDQYSTHYLNLFFRNKYDKVSARAIQQVLVQNNYNIIASNNAFEELVKHKQLMKSRRKPTALPNNLQNIPLLQELAYVTHKEHIKTYLEEKSRKEEQERIEAKENGQMQTCQCCFDDEVMPKDTFTCPNGCNFCKSCIKRSCEVALGEGKTDFLCLADCSVEFTLQTLQNVLPPKMFSKLAQKKALAEIKAAGIEELEMCPFCDFATIPNEADKIFRCLNQDCMKESCRLCKEPNHVPLKCEEVEKDEDVKARTYVEDKMTEALIRKCWKCGTRFFKEEGCNKMTCSCGAQMCYICKEPVNDYSHFNGIGGDNYDLCPLYSDTNLVNQQNVMKAAEAAKAKIDPTNLKVDPAADVANHYKKRAEDLPREPHMNLLHVNNPVPPPHHHHHHQHMHLRHNQRADLLREQQQRILYWVQQRHRHRQNR